MYGNVGFTDLSSVISSEETSTCNNFHKQQTSNLAVTIATGAHCSGIISHFLCSNVIKKVCVVSIGFLASFVGHERYVE
jgi:hypothetical protein